MSDRPSAFPFAGMTESRWTKLMADGMGLTPEEELAGWYFSYAWDGLLLHRDWAEAKFDLEPPTR